MIRRLIILGTLLCFVPILVSAQGFRIGDANTVQSSLNTPGVISVLPATVAVCVSPANAVPCTNKAQTYTSVTLGITCPTSTQVTLAGSNTCVTGTDTRGNWGAWVAAGNYDITFTIPNGNSFGPYTISVGIPPGTNISPGTVTATNLTVSGTGTLAKINGVCAVDGTTNTTLAAAVTCAGTNGVVDVPMFAVPTLTANVTVPAGVTLKFEGGSPGLVQLGNFILTVNGPLIAPDAQIFTTAGTGTVTLGLNAISSGVRSTWFPGGDGGAKINAADTSFAGTPGKILVTQNGGTTWTAAVTITAQHNVQLDCGFYATAQINIGSSGTPQNSASFSGCPQSPPFASSSTATTTLFQSNGTNSATGYLNLSGSYVLLRDLVIDGNGANNTTSGPNIFLLGSNHSIQNVLSRNSHSHGLQLGNGASPLRGTGTVMQDFYSNNNTGSGILANWTTDLFLSSGVVLDNNSRYGFECTGCSGIHIAPASDLSGNTLGGALFSGTSAFNSGLSEVIGVIFKNNGGIDLDLESDAGGTAHCEGFKIVGNTFGGLAVGTTANTFDAIKSNGCGHSAIGFNVIEKSSTAPTYKYGIEIAEPTGGQALVDTIGFNQCTAVLGGGTPIGTSCLGQNATTSSYYDANNLNGIVGQAAYREFTETSAPSGVASVDVCYGDFSSHALKCSYNNGTFFNQTQTIGTGNVTTAGTAINTLTCQAQTAITVTGAATTDNVIANIGATLPATWQTGIAMQAHVTAINTVTVYLCNPTATATITPAATQVNVRVVR